MGMTKIKPLFIPLMKEYFQLFRDGKKTREIRKYGAKWRLLTCVTGRAVTLACGYGWPRLSGVIAEAKMVDFLNLEPEDQIAVSACYGMRLGDFIVISITDIKEIRKNE